jgi:hypothetical protein
MAMSEIEAQEFAKQLTLELIRSGEFPKVAGKSSDQVGKIQADVFIAFHDRLLEHFRPKADP